METNQEEVCSWTGGGLNVNEWEMLHLHHSARFKGHSFQSLMVGPVQLRNFSLLTEANKLF